MAIIQLMDEILANKIAAGEVVERVASVIKELVENSIDAASSEITVELKEAGTREMRVTDNGKGMDKEDAVMAFNRHATSKLLKEEDLYHIETLGFRGEALASIASVSDVTLKTSTGGVGTIVHISGGKVLEVTSGDARMGTSIVVKDLFYNTPARLKYMKSLYTELASVIEYMNKIALSHPEIRFTLSNNDSVLLSTDGSGNLLKTIHNIYGIETVKKMLPVESSNEDYQVKGYISLPEIHRSSRNHMITLVNGRVVRNMELNRVINDSYHGFKPDNRYPIVVLEITVDPSLVDVNIHPTKMDIKFSKMEELTALIMKMIEEKLLGKTLIPKIEVKESLPNEEGIISRPVYQEMTLELERTAIEMPETPIFANTDFTEMRVAEDVEVFNEERLPELYPVGVVHGTYIICQNEQGMYLIDQHAAKERINYEIYREKLGNPKQESISLLFPITIEFANNEYIILKENFEFLINLGFEIEEFGINSIIIKSHPTWLPRGYEEEAIRRILDVLLQEEKHFNLARFNENVSKMLSCKMSIKANDNITLSEMENLIADLRKCKNPFNCPHGRPTVIFYSKYDLEKLFKRSGF